MAGAAAERVLLRVAGAASLVAAGLHGAVTEEHLRQWWGYGAFFVAAAFAQAVSGLLFLALASAVADRTAATGRTIRRAAWAGIAGNALIIGTYVLTRTVGVPLGPSAGEGPEVVGAVDVASKAAEVLLILSLAGVLARGRAAAARPHGSS